MRVRVLSNLRLAVPVEVVAVAMSANRRCLRRPQECPSSRLVLPIPSPEDVELTQHVSEAGTLLDIAVLDHVIIGSGQPGFVSLKERGLGFGRDGRGR